MLDDSWVAVVRMCSSIDDLEAFKLLVIHSSPLILRWLWLDV